MSCLCLGPKRAGKTHLLLALQDPNSVDATTYSMPTLGTSLYTIKFPAKSKNDCTKLSAPAAAATGTLNNTNNVAASSAMPTGRQHKHLSKSITILEIGGQMAPLWRRYFNNVEKLIYVVDTSNLCQISAAGVLLYSILTEPRLQKTKFLLVLTKMDYAYRQMRNEALLMLQMSKLQKQIRQNMTIVEASAVTNMGLELIHEWLRQP